MPKKRLCLIIRSTSSKHSWINMQLRGLNTSTEMAQTATNSKFKKLFKMEYYILCTPPALRKNFTKLRISAHRLEIEAGRYTRPKTAIENRKCQLCSLNKIEDEYHLFMECPIYSIEREEFCMNLKQCKISFQNNWEVISDIMSTLGGNPYVCKIICLFVNACFKKRFNKV